MAKKKELLQSPVAMLVKAIMDLGWSVTVPKNDIVVGMIIGKEAYIRSVMKAMKAGKWKLPAALVRHTSKEVDDRLRMLAGKSKKPKKRK